MASGPEGCGWVAGGRGWPRVETSDERGASEIGPVLNYHHDTVARQRSSQSDGQTQRGSFQMSSRSAPVTKRMKSLKRNCQIKCIETMDRMFPNVSEYLMLAV